MTPYATRVRVTRVAGSHAVRGSVVVMSFSFEVGTDHRLDQVLYLGLERRDAESTAGSNLFFPYSRADPAQRPAAVPGVRALERRYERAGGPGEPARRAAERDDREPHLAVRLAGHQERLLAALRMPGERAVPPTGRAFLVDGPDDLARRPEAYRPDAQPHVEPYPRLRAGRRGADRDAGRPVHPPGEYGVPGHLERPPAQPGPVPQVVVPGRQLTGTGRADLGVRQLAHHNLTGVLAGRPVRRGPAGCRRWSAPGPACRRSRRCAWRQPVR